ncbi:conserved protein of unknown function [Oenococcus oeni]|uniref:hypothetical protein n=1 Tax=Oenococcus oeni TaxID=1247 RepID=UPI001077E462|nr:hypothetical protein [Oenococcus oeni]AVI94927.1 hypothetical protein AX764_08970 [Oenococcus oeni]SYV98595.1 conserved hypothetical protein [Oenococcus oeni]SYW05186.1 conserved hypothetical protein [Oenococcus oeni]SYW19330.1 conserved hypothetical protein [Oenococcus oeni]VDC15564.1 conserved protein of unknown function [Oenococcus oeni]
MPWNEKDYPVSMKNMKKVVRDKAIDIANALKEEKYSDQKAISIATEQAEKWYRDHHKGKEENPFLKSKRDQE